MPQEDLKAAINRAISAFNNSQDRSGYFNLYDSKSLQGHGFPPNLPSNFEGMRMFYHVLWRAFPDSHLVIIDLIVEGDKQSLGIPSWVLKKESLWAYRRVAKE
jgi:hypothetical protein